MSQIRLITQCYDLIHDYFKDPKKTIQWFDTKNPGLGFIKPLDMIRAGRAEKLLKFIKAQRDGNLP